MHNDQYTFRTTAAVTEQDVAEIYEQLHAYNLTKREEAAQQPIGVFTEDANGKKLAGLTGMTYGNWLCVKYLFVSEALRGQGVGSRLLDTAEREARERGCKFVFLDTFSFQAPDFYLKHGYTEVFTLAQYPLTGARHYYTKAL